MTRLQQAMIAAACSSGKRITLNGKVIWKGVTAGGTDEIQRTWNRSQKLFLKRVKELQKGDDVVIYRYRRIPGEKGTWVKDMQGHVGGIMAWL